MFSQHHFSLIDFYITSGNVVRPSGHFREYILHLTIASRWLHDIVKPSHTIRINIVCKTTTSCIVRDCFGYNRVSIVCPSVGFVHASAQHWLDVDFNTRWTHDYEKFQFRRGSFRAIRECIVTHRMSIGRLLSHRHHHRGRHQNL